MKDGPLYGRYTITHKDGTPVDPAKRYFVLAIGSDIYARAALRAYVEACEVTHPQLAADLRREYDIAPIERIKSEPGIERHDRGGDRLPQEG